MKTYLRKYLFALASVLCFQHTIAGDVAIKTNLLYWATTTPNIGVEAGLSDHLSFSANIGYNAFNFPNQHSSPNLNPKLHHWLLMPEGKYWFSRVFSESYLGLHLLGGQYNVGGLKFPRFLKHTRYQGWGISAGVSYGYMWHLGHRWNMEFSAGVGYVYLNYSKYNCGNCGKKLGSRRRHYVGPTKLALSVYYILPSGRSEASVKDNATALDQQFPDYPMPSPVDVSENVPVDSIPEVKIPSDSVPLTPLNELSTTAVASTATPAVDTLRFTVHYLVDRSELRPELADNRREFARLDSLLSAYHNDNKPEIHSGENPKGAEILSVSVEGYASPEHNFIHNKRLSADRADAVRDWLRERYALPVAIESIGMGEDITRFRQLMRSRFGERYVEILESDMNADDADEMEITLRSRARSADYQIIRKEIFPTLRRTEIVIVVKQK